MIIIDTKHQEAYSCVSKAAAARIISVSVSTIHRWAAMHLFYRHNHWELYFNEQRMKQNKGYGMKQKNNVYPT